MIVFLICWWVFPQIWPILSRKPKKWGRKRTSEVNIPQVKGGDYYGFSGVFLSPLPSFPCRSTLKGHWHKMQLLIAGKFKPLNCSMTLLSNGQKNLQSLFCNLISYQLQFFCHFNNSLFAKWMAFFYNWDLSLWCISAIEICHSGVHDPLWGVANLMFTLANREMPANEREGKYYKNQEIFVVCDISMHAETAESIF